MPITRIDVVRLFDIDLSRGGRIPDPRDLLQTRSSSETYARYAESFSWLFDPQDTPGNAEQVKTNPTVRYLSENVHCPFALTGFDRFSLARNSEDQSDKGGVITISRNLRIAVLSIWNRYQPTEQAIDIKLSLDTDIPSYYLNQISVLFPYIADAELMYPFFAIRYDEADLSQVLATEGVFLGRLFSGGLDHESDARLKDYLSDNVSIRRYEALFVRSSDGLGVYSSHVENDSGQDERLYENTFFRAVQVCEVCLIEHQLLRTFKTRVDIDAKKVRVFPRPFLVEKRRSELLALEIGIVKALPFRTAEAPPLVRKTQQRFSIPESLQDAKDSYDFLETRYQNTKTTALAIIAVIAYICDKLKLWEWLGAFLSTHVNLFIHAQKHIG